MLTYADNNGRSSEFGLSDSMSRVETRPETRGRSGPKTIHLNARLIIIMKDFSGHLQLSLVPHP
jgi:hypothetical protein